jgi:hypothetical protein
VDGSHHAHAAFEEMLKFAKVCQKSAPQARFEASVSVPVRIMLCPLLQVNEKNTVFCLHCIETMPVVDYGQIVHPEFWAASGAVVGADAAKQNEEARERGKKARTAISLPSIPCAARHLLCMDLVAS